MRLLRRRFRSKGSIRPGRWFLSLFLAHSLINLTASLRGCGSATTTWSLVPTHGSSVVSQTWCLKVLPWVEESTTVVSCCKSKLQRSLRLLILQKSSSDDLPTGRIPCKGCQSLRIKRKQQRGRAFSGALLFTQRECCALIAINQLSVVVCNTLLLCLCLLQSRLPSYPTSTQSLSMC